MTAMDHRSRYIDLSARFLW